MYVCMLWMLAHWRRTHKQQQIRLMREQSPQSHHRGRCCSCWFTHPPTHTTFFLPVWNSNCNYTVERSGIKYNTIRKLYTSTRTFPGSAAACINKRNFQQQTHAVSDVTTALQLWPLLIADHCDLLVRTRHDIRKWRSQHLDTWHWWLILLQRQVLGSTVSNGASCMSRSTWLKDILVTT